MKKILVPICIHTGLEQIRSAAAEAAAIYRREDSVQIHLLSIQVPLSRHVSDFFEEGELRQIHIESGRAELRPARAVLDAAGVPYLTHVEIGRTAETIVSFATDIRCDRIVIGQGPQTGFADKLFGTLASEVRHLLGGAAPCRVVGA